MILVAGAGAMGAGIAYRLAERGADVVLCDRGTIASGSTSRAMGGVRQQFSTAAEVRLAQQSIAFFAELGMEMEGETTVEGPWVDQTVGLNDVRADITMMRTPDGHGRVELSRFHTPPAVRAEPESAPANALGIRRIMFAVDDIDDVVARLRSHGAELVGEIAQYEDIYRLCFLRGPEGIIIGLAEQLN